MEEMKDPRLVALETKVSRYHELDVVEKETKAEKDPLNKDIKVDMKALGLNNLEVGSLEAVYSVQDRTSMDTEKLLAFLEANGLEQAIKTVRTPDERVVEDLIHQGHIKAEQIAHCLVVKQVEVLSVKNRAKKSKKAETTPAPTPVAAAAAPAPKKDYGDTF